MSHGDESCVSVDVSLGNESGTRHSARFAGLRGWGAASCSINDETSFLINNAVFAGNNAKVLLECQRASQGFEVQSYIFPN